MNRLMHKTPAMLAALAMVVGAQLAAAQAPNVTLSKDCPSLRYLNREATFTITVANRGDAPALDVVVSDMVPSGITFRSADNGGAKQGSNVVWRIGTLAPGESKTLTSQFACNQIGQFTNRAAVRYCAELMTECTTEVQGIPALLLEMVDVEDPDEVGTTDTYIITVTNQGTATDTDIVIKATVQAEADYVSADGPVGHSASGKMVTFEPLPTLAPKAKATYRVVIRGNSAGDTRFKVTMTSNQFTSAPVEETESTRFYE